MTDDFRTGAGGDGNPLPQHELPPTWWRFIDTETPPDALFNEGLRATNANIAIEPPPRRHVAFTFLVIFVVALATAAVVIATGLPIVISILAVMMATSITAITGWAVWHKGNR